MKLIGFRITVIANHAFRKPSKLSGGYQQSYYMSPDCTGVFILDAFFQISEFSYKLHGPCLKYEVKVNIYAMRILWINEAQCLHPREKYRGPGRFYRETWQK